MSDHGDSGIGDSKCYCSNLLSLPDGGSTTEWPGGSICVICHHSCVVMRHIYVTEFGTVVQAEGNPEGTHGVSGTTAGPKAIGFRGRRIGQAA